MKKTMLGRFSEFGKWKDYIAYKTFEFKFSAITAIIIWLFFWLFLDVYGKFDVYVIPFQNFTAGIIQALIGMLGIILAGLAIVISILNNEIVHKIEDEVERKEGIKNAVSRILASFEFLAFTISIWIFLFFIINISLYSKETLINVFFFYSLLIVVTFFLSFIIFYTVALISNCVRIFYISNLKAKNIKNDKTFHDLTNEIRIDYIIRTICIEKHLSPEEFLEDLNMLIDSMEIENKELVKKYFQNYYIGEKNNKNDDSVE